MTITDINHRYGNKATPIIEQGIICAEVYIGSNSFIGCNAYIAPGVRIGKHCVVGANSVVLGDVPDFSIVAGIPAKIVKRID